ncbi:hypothetical protein KSP39_PZI022333 [Platanthera zijinensis]|uniref:DUF7812 domain-containing protein n=1 Tax=Platanthera zijinensis TaxID=2320716 RepID=A0AAP0AV11_9ASPA
MEDLRNFHCLLKELDPYELQGQVFTENRYHNPSVAKVKSDVLIMLSDSLFEELLKQFENIQALLKCSVDGVVEPNPESEFTKDEFIVLLRCCLMMVQFLEFDTSILWEKCGVLLKILGNVCPLSLGLDSHDCSSVTTINPFSQCCSNFLGRINDESYEMLKFFSMILEVFIAVFSENVGLRKNLILVYNLTSNSEKLCSCRNADSDSFNLLVLVSCHFLFSVKNGLNFSRFLHLLSGSSYLDKMTPVISLNANLRLINAPFILSAPRILQAHLILLATRCIAYHPPFDGRKSDTPIMSYYTNIFEFSVNLYVSYISTLQLDDALFRANVGSNFGVIAPIRDPIAHRMTWDELTHQANYLADLAHFLSESIPSDTKSEVLAYSATYIRADHPLIDELCKEATYLVVDYMLENILPRNVWEQGQNENKERLPQELYCLAAAINLMNSLLLHIISQSTQTGCHDKVSRPSCITYDCLSLSASITRVSGCGTDQQVQKFLHDMFGDYGGIHMELKFMLAHISSLLVFSLRRKLDFLWKGCLSMMMTLINLLLFEERNLGLSKIFKLVQSHPTMSDKGPIYRSTSVMIAANLQKAKMLYLKNKIKCGHVEENRTNATPRSEVDQPSGISSVEGTEERWVQGNQGNAGHGERFTKCIPNFHKNPTEWNDLIDFIECDPEKDYLLWLSNRKKFNKWKQEKIALLKLQKRSFGIAYHLNSRARTGAGESVKVKSQEQRSRKLSAKSIKVREMHESKRQASSADPLELEYLVEPIECRSENEKHGEAEVHKEKKRKKTAFATVKDYSLRSRLGADKSIRVKSQDQQSRISGVECVEDREVHETKGQALSADSSKLEDLVEPIEGWSENGKHGEAEVLMKRTKSKRKTFAIVKVYNLRSRIGANKNIEIKPK